MNDAVAICMNTHSGGYTTTANFTDQGDGLRKALSGVQGTDRATLNFPAGFSADFAIAFDQGFGGVWELVENGGHNYIISVGLSPTGTTTASQYTFTLAKADIGNPPGFYFLVTYVSESGYRSNEFIGDNGPAANPQNSAYTATSSLVFANPLPVGFSNPAAQSISQSVKVSWNITADCMDGVFGIERSANGTDFTSIGSLDCTRSLSYSFEDIAPLNGNNYYRIANVGINGKKSYSKTVVVNIPVRESLNAFVTGNRLKVIFNTTRKDAYTATLISSDGKIVLSKTIKYDGNSNSIDLEFKNTLSPGIYTLLMRGKGHSKSLQLYLK